MIGEDSINPPVTIATGRNDFRDGFTRLLLLLKQLFDDVASVAEMLDGFAQSFYHGVYLRADSLSILSVQRGSPDCALLLIILNTTPAKFVATIYYICSA
ncbi:MAG: hypothetical protein H0T63_10435 [Pyrinomonadaceae bacterium]|nr:hypothetical protein [Pyrinomonadaceae bacterium]